MQFFANLMKYCLDLKEGTKNATIAFNTKLMQLCVENKYNWNAVLSTEA